MESNRRKVKISDIASSERNSITIGPFGSRMKADCYVTKGVAVVRGTNLSSGKTFSGDFVYISYEKADELKSCNVFEDDLVFPHRGAIGEVGIVPKSDGNRWVMSSSLMKLTCNKEVILPLYVYYFFKSHFGKYELLKNASTVGTPGIATPLTSLKAIEIPLPSIQEQKGIIQILCSLDDKIELNRQMNQTLEQMAQALFKSWFVDFDPVIDNALAAGNSIPEELQAKAEKRKALGKDRKTLPEEIQKLFPNELEYSKELEKWVPKGWQSVKFDSIAEVKYGKDHKKLDEGTIPVYGSGGVMRFVNQSLYTGESVLIPRKGTLSNLMYVNEEFWSVDTMFFTKLKLKKHAKYLYYNLKLLDFNEMNVGSAVPSMTTKVLSSLNFILPPANLVMVFDDHIQGLYTKIEANTKQINKLTKTRDTLLPKLISGEVRVPDAESTIKF